MQHADSYSLSPPQGENLAMNMPSFDIPGRVRAWYTEVDDCASLPGCEQSTGGAVGHFTALVWKGAKELGCGHATANGNYQYYVCRYAAGPSLSGDTPNMMGHYVANVGVLVKDEATCRAELR